MAAASVADDDDDDDDETNVKGSPESSHVKAAVVVVGVVVMLHTLQPLETWSERGVVVDVTRDCSCMDQSRERVVEWQCVVGTVADRKVAAVLGKRVPVPPG